MAENQVAIVTGGAQGIGASITKLLLKKGYNVVVADIQEEKGNKFVEEQQKIEGKSRILFCLCDVSKLEDFKALFEFTLEKFKTVDVLVNNAGVVCEKQPQVILNTNVMGPLYGCQVALQYMGKSQGGEGGAVINIASIAGFLTDPAFPAYCASKHAIIGLTRSYGHPYYLEKENVLFSALCPSYVKTNLLLEDLPKNALIKRTDFTVKKLLDPDFVAEGVLKLLEDRINGSTLVCTSNEEFFYVGLQKEFENIVLD